MALGHLVLGVPHDGRAVHIGGDVPAKALIEQVILGGRGQILAAADHVGNAHQVVVDDVGEVIGGQAVTLDKHLVVQGLVLHGDVAEDGIVEGGGALVGDFLADDIGLARIHPGLSFLQAQRAARILTTVKLAGVLLALGLLAEAVVGVALLHQQLGILSISVPALGLDIGSHRAAHIGTLVVVQVALGQSLVDKLSSALYLPGLVGVLNAQDKGAAGIAGDEPGVQGGTQIADVHIARGRGGKTGTDLPLGDFGLHLLKILMIQSHTVPSVSGWAA